MNFKIVLGSMGLRSYFYCMKKNSEKRVAVISVKVRQDQKNKFRIKAAEEGKTISTKMSELLYDYISR